MTDALSALLDTFDSQLHDLVRRQFLVEAFKAELDKVTRNEPFRVRNGVLWLMFFDTRDALVVHLASWARAVYQPGGLIDQLRANHAPDLPSRRPPGPHDDDSSWRARRDREHADALTRLFPGTSGAYPSDSQFDQLRDTFVARMKPVVDDASDRVRPYDRDPQAETVEPLEFSALRNAISFAERLLNDLSMVGRHTEHEHREKNTPEAADVVPDMVDAILLGTPEQIERVRGELDRIAFYDELHHRHAKEPSQYFNDRLFSSSTAAGAGAGPTQSEPRYLGFFPALPLEKNLELGEWVVGNPPDGTPWASERFRELSQTLIRSFEKRSFRGGALLWHRDRGFDGSKPTDDEIGAIRAAVTFAALDANDRFRLTEPDDGNKARYVATMENADIFIQPITDDDGTITHRRGGLLKGMIVGNMKIGAEPPPLADAVEPIFGAVPASGLLARAIFDEVRADSRRGRAVAIAAEWHRVAMSNPLAVTIQQRLIALKTGFEALLGTSDSRSCASQLRTLFEVATLEHRDLVPCDGLLWSPKERVHWRWIWTKDRSRHLDGQSELERWFSALTRARNDIIHNGRLTTVVFEAPADRPLSRYSGKLHMTGERILREAIKARISGDVLLCGALARRALAEATFGEWVRERIAAARARSAAGAETPASAVEAHPPRAVSEILAYLQVDAANVVVVGQLRLAGAGYTHEASAHRGQVTMSLTESEFVALRVAGAEDELPDSWDPCP